MDSKTKNILLEAKSYLFITLGVLIYAVAWISILAEASVMGGGASGIGLLIFKATGGAEGGGIPIGTSFFFVNLILLIIGGFTIGFKFGAKTIYAILAISVFMRLGQAYLPPDIFQISGDKFLSSILGGAICGVGISICFASGGSTGGTDIIAMILNKYFRLSVGRVLVYCDLVIVGGAIFIFKDVSAGIYGYVTMGVVGYTVDMIMNGNKQTMQLMIMTKNYKEVAAAVIANTSRGATLLKSVGWYTQSEGYVVMVCCRRNEVGLIHSVIKHVDPDAFITSSPVSGILGKGFDELKVKRKNGGKLK